VIFCIFMGLCIVNQITAVPAPDDGCQHPKHVELPTEM